MSTAYTAAVMVRAGRTTDIDSFSSTHRTAKYIMQAVEDTGEIESCEFTLIQANGQCYIAVWGTVFSKQGLGGIQARYQQGQIFVSYIPLSKRTIEVSFKREVL